MFKQKTGQSTLFGLLALISALLAPLPLWAHGGAPVELDSCRIPIIGQWVHFTAYTPTLTADEEHCKSIPQLGMTNLVFDYEQKPLRKMMVEFEITKEPEGKRIFYQEPKMQKTGSMDTVVDFAKFGAGDYLAHVTLELAGKKVNAHLPFAVGVGSSSIGATSVLVIAIIGISVFLYFVSTRTKAKAPAMFSVRNGGKEKLDDSTHNQAT